MGAPNGDLATGVDGRPARRADAARTFERRGARAPFALPFPPTRNTSAIPILDYTGSPIGMVSESDLIGRDETERNAQREWLVF